MSLIIPANTLASGGFAVDNSCRFNSGSSDDLRISDYSGAGTSRRIRTYSMWIKRSELSYAVIFGGSGGDHWVFTADHKIQINIGSGTDSRRITDMVFRDVSAWYHIVFAYDTTQGTASNRFTMWVNGEVATTSIVGGKNEVAQNEDALVFINGDNSKIGSDGDSASYFDGYMAEWVFVDGQKLDADSFGEFDSDSNIWKPIDVSGLTFGTNGFYLNFADSSDLGIDAGNDNDFEPTNLTAIDQTTDTPTNNFATLNPLKFSGGTFSEGNLKFTGIASNWKNRYSTIGVSSGKWFMEFKMGSITADQSGVAIVSDITPDGNFPAVDSTRVPAIAYNSDGNKYVNGTASSGYFSAMSTNDIIGIALDMDNGTVQFYRNGSTTGSAIDLSDGFSTSQYPLFFCGAVYSTRDTQANFGNPTFTGTDQSDGNSRGSFEYAPPSGYLSLCTANLSEVLG